MDNENKIQVEFMEDNDEVITLYDDNDKAVDFYQIACIEYEGEFYAVMQPAEDIEGVDDDEAVIFKIVEEDEDTDLFLPVESEELIEKLFDEYLKAAADEVE